MVKMLQGSVVTQTMLGVKAKNRYSKPLNVT